MLAARARPALYREQAIQLGEPDRPFGQRMADPCPRRQFIEAPITGTMGQPFVGDHLQNGKLARGEACADSGGNGPVAECSRRPGAKARLSGDRCSGDRWIKWRGPQHRVERQARSSASLAGTGSAPQLLRLVVADDPGTVGAPELAGVVIELASSGAPDRGSERVIEHRSLPQVEAAVQDMGIALSERRFQLTNIRGCGLRRYRIWRSQIPSRPDQFAPDGGRFHFPLRAAESISVGVASAPTLLRVIRATHGAIRPQHKAPADLEEILQGARRLLITSHTPLTHG